MSDEDAVKENQILGPPINITEVNQGSNSLLVEIHQQTLLQDYRMSVADEQRKMILQKLDALEERTKDLETLKRDLAAMTAKVTVLEEWRLMGLGGAYFAKILWAVGGGVLVALVLHFLRKG